MINKMMMYSLVILITGLFYFLISISYFREDLLILSLTQMMAGSCGFFLLDKDTQKYPQYLKTKKY